MKLRTLASRGLAHYWRTNVATALGVIAGTAALTGALLVGDSMRGSLREAALGRLGRIDFALVAPRFFRAATASDIATERRFDEAFVRIGSAILLRGSTTHAESRATVDRVNIVGANSRFWQLDPTRDAEGDLPATSRTVVLNEPLAAELRAAPGDEILLRLGKPSAVSTETLLGRRDDAALTLRLTVQGVISAEGLGAFSLSARQALPRNAYVPMETLQRALDRPNRVNALLVEARPGNAGLVDIRRAVLDALLKEHLGLEDVGLRLRVDEAHRYVALESEAFLLDPALEAAARAAATRIGSDPSAVLSYLANTMAVEGRPERVIPYSTVAALQPGPELRRSLPLTDGSAWPELAPGEIVLNEWAAQDLQATPGDSIRLSYYVSEDSGALRTAEATFRLRGIARLDGAAADPGFTPEYPGVTDSASVADWDPPFPIDLRKIRDQDERYWDQYRATPKAFVSLADGQRLWATQPERLGRITSLRVYPRAGQTLETARAAFERELLAGIEPAQVGMTFDAVRARMQIASKGATDFGGLFIGFSFFLIVSAAMLVALLFRLGVERRSGEVGLLLALGYGPGRVVRLLLTEGVLVAAIAAAFGLAAARGYAWLMLAGLRSWWADAVNTPFLRLHDSASSYFIGYVVGVLIAAASIAWSLRGLTRLPARALLAGVIQSGRTAPGRRGAVVAIVTLVGVGLAGLMSALTFVTDAVSQSVAFFCSGTALLVACVAGLMLWLRIEPRAAIQTAGRAALIRLGVRNARRRVGRSVLTAGLIASASFVIAALQAMRLEPPEQATAKDSGTGGAMLFAESAVPLPYDLDTVAGRASLNVSAEAEAALARATFTPMRLRDGDETSCLNLYRPTQPRVLGASDAMIARGGFAFSGTLAESDGERGNPWRLLRRDFPDGAIPAIADEAAVMWQLHSKLGGDVVITDERGREVRLRFVALLKGSFLQGELIIGERQFARVFPSISGSAFYLIDVDPERAALVEATLERELAQFGLAVTDTRRRLAELQAVQNTYLSTFQALGGLGLLLGTFGLAAVLLRSVWERRSELALLAALGYSRPALGWLVLSEHVLLVAAGVLAGLLSAGVAVAPHVASRPGVVPWPSLLLMFLAVFATGVLAGLAALIPALRARLVPALRSE